MRWSIGRMLALAPLVVLVGCAKQYPSSYPSSEYRRSELTGESGANSAEIFRAPSPIQAKIDEWVQNSFPPPWTFPAGELDEAKQRLLTGQQLYQKHCVHCHGLAGGGDGPTAASLMPRPRDFRRGIFKWKSTASRAKPTREDLISVLHEGAMGTSMPPFNLMTQSQLDALTDYVIYLSQRGEFERQLQLVYSQEGPSASELAESGEPMSEEDLEELKEILDETAEESMETIVESWETAEDAVVEAAEEELPAVGTSEFEESVQRGKAAYLSSNAGCTKCHGVDGRGRADLTGADALDAWGFPNPPRNLTLGLFRGGRRPIDIYRRIHQGIAGSSMPGQSVNPKVTEQDIWDLVNFVRALPLRPEMLATGVAESSEGAPSHP